VSNESTRSGRCESRAISKKSSTDSNYCSGVPYVVFNDDDDNNDNNKRKLLHTRTKMEMGWDDAAV